MELVVDLRRETSVLGDGSETEHSGQDHDRIDVDMEDAASEQSSEHTAEEQEQETQHTLSSGHSAVDVEMDTTPDPSANDGQPLLDHNGACLSFEAHARQ